MIGRTFSHYRIVADLGSGGMGVVYEAEDTRLGRHVALKLLPLEACSDPEAMDRFLREARIISSLSHPHICTLHDIGEHEGQQFMVMELLEGESFKERIARGPLPIDEVLELGAQIADALDAAHSAGVIHRDIKPANLFITRRGQAKVLDFGVAKLSEVGAAARPDLARTVAGSELTTLGSAIGTVSYMSPEQARGQDIDARSDLFSLGEVIYEMAAGQQAFPGSTPAVIFEGILTGQPIPASHLNAHVPPELDRIIGKALEKDRETRYQTAAEVRADLKRLKRETDTGRTAAMTGAFGAADPRSTTGPAASRLMPSPGKRRRKALLIGAPLVTIALVGGALLWQSQRTPALTSRDAVILAEFRNRTGDTMFDDTLSEALAVQLRQSPYLNLLPEQQLQATLRLMGRQPTESITPDIAREVCQRAEAKAMLGGTIAMLGRSYVLTLSAQDCITSETLAEEQIQANGKEEVITALGDAASRFREKLGESLASVQRYDQKIEQATTRSLEALKAYSQGMTTRRTQGDFDSTPFFKRAIELDPEFALAHARLGTVLSNLGDVIDAEKATTRAYELREKVSARERLYIEARYYTTVARSQDKAIESYRLLLATYPDDFAAHSNLGSLYRSKGRLKEAIASLEKAVSLAPGQPLGYINLGYAYIDEGRYAEARKAFEEVLKLQESTNARNGLLVIATLVGDRALADAQIEAVRGRRDEADQIAVRAIVAAYKGQMKESQRLADDLFNRMQAANRLHLSGEAFLGFAINQAAVGRFDVARADLDRIRQYNMITEGTADEMVALGAVLRDPKLSEAYLARAIEEVQKFGPSPTPADMTLDVVPRSAEAAKAERAARALVALAAGRNQEAYDLAMSVGDDSPQRHSLFIAGLAALGMEQWDDATQVFTTMSTERAKLGLSTIPGIVQVMLGRAHAGAGRLSEARKAYDEGFAIWKDADADMPLLVEARQEYARLGT